MRTTVRVIQGRLAESEPHRTSAIEAAYQHFRLDKQGSLVSPKTLQHYEWTIRPFLQWLTRSTQKCCASSNSVSIWSASTGLTSRSV